jgi:hypothetical protein
VPTFADRGCHVVSVTDPYGRILGFLDQDVSEYVRKMVVRKDMVASDNRQDIPIKEIADSERVNYFIIE